MTADFVILGKWNERKNPYFDFLDTSPKAQYDKGFVGMTRENSIQYDEKK